MPDVFWPATDGVRDYRTGLSRQQMSLWFAGVQKTETGKFRAETAAMSNKDDP
jgi:hypothetical protein